MKPFKLFIKFTISVILILFISQSPEAKAQDGQLLPEFFNKLYFDNIKVFESDHDEDYKQFCEIYKVDRDNPSNKEKFFKVLFFHKMFTGSNSVDCAKGGMLKIPYFWHWIKPNPRHKIIDNQSGTLLINKKPPKGFSKYKSHADIDRTPYIYLNDLVSEKPRYRHPDCSEFYTFGWCSEREMTFSLLMDILYGFKSKVVQEGPHVTSDIWLEFTDRTGKETSLIARVDNTYDITGWKYANNIVFDKWYNDMGNIKMVKWYNSKARSNKEREMVKNIRVEPKAATRIKGLVN